MEETPSGVVRKNPSSGRKDFLRGDLIHVY